MRPLARRAAVLALAALPIGIALPAWARPSGAERTPKAVDTDKDGTIDLKEARAAAEGIFDKAVTDQDGTLATKELGGRLSRKDLKAADGDDGTLDKTEYLALVEQRFKAADLDGDGTLDAKALKSPAGKSLMPFLK